jgi:hypothetical protein
MNQYKNDTMLDDPHVNETFSRKMKAVLSDLRGHGGEWYVTCVYRSPAEQRYLYSKGRSTATLRKAGFTDDEIKQYRSRLYKETGKNTIGSRVTTLLSSKHCKGIACDIVPVIDGGLRWDAEDKIWALVGSSAKAHGLTWGGTWKKFVDKPHVELP